MPVLTEPPSMGDVLKYEVNPNYTREVVTLLAGMPYPVGAVLGRITASDKFKLATSGGTDGAQTASAVLLYAVDATLADATGIVVARGPAIVSRAALAYDATVDDAAKITTKIGQLAAELDAPVMIHLAEMTDEVATLRREHQRTPVEYLDDLGLLNRRLVAAHCIFVTDSDLALLRDREAGVAHAMVANIKSAKGVAPALRMHELGLRVGLATDGPMSGNTLDIIGQLGYVAKVHKLDRKDRNVMPAIEVVTMATRGGARALHLEDRIGSLEAGKLADVVILEAEATHLIPLYDPYAALVYAAGPRDVRTTIIHGRVVMEDRRVLTVDVAEVRARMRALATRIQTAVARGLP